ncbi:hypothetical protein GCM10009069_21800 [Algimonas arctica]|uniref:Uncharacterized protein n=1 Tax=Algimonas arctica TaxID=1479486 RepID=A0A8J3CRD7_9PROT|nr:hypothetical protein GCM10009069_21800 [Algimonas arctica]
MTPIGRADPNVPDGISIIIAVIAVDPLCHAGGTFQLTTIAKDNRNRLTIEEKRVAGQTETTISGIRIEQRDIQQSAICDSITVEITRAVCAA